jgi:CPA2 family monovalent cation:H+ antiporter-2
MPRSRKLLSVPQLDFLKDLVVILAAAVVVVVLLRRLGVPVIAGFILTGVLIGPTTLRLVDDTHQVEVLAEVGVVLLLFGIGLELSLERLRRLWKAVVLGGGIQVTATVALTALVANSFGLSPGASVFVGFIVAVSSTAVVLRGLSRRGELNAPHGRLAVGILVFQDLCVVPMILSVPFLSSRGGSSEEVLRTAGTAVLVLGGVLAAGVVLVPRVLAFVAKTRERDLFVLTVFLICLGTAWLLSLAGISLALGAFLAGLVVSGSEFRHQALSDLIPTREVFASVFFVSVGMLLDVSEVLAHWLPITWLLLAIITGKFVIVLGTGLALRLPLNVAILSAATLSQVGEFSFVLLNAGSGTGLVAASFSHMLLAAIILSMVLTPLAISFGPHLASGAGRFSWLNRRLGAPPPGVDEQEPHSDHVIVAGYALTGRAVCQVLRDAGIRYIAVEINPDNVREARSAGDRVVLGDVTQHELLEELGCAQARLVVLSINDPRAAERATRMIRHAAPNIPILVRAQYVMDRDALLVAGATTVVTAEETARDEIVRALRESGRVSLSSPPGRVQSGQHQDDDQ